MSVRTSCKLLLVCSIVLCAAVAMAQAPSTIFQLNGNADNSNLTCAYGPCDYWDLLNGTGAAGSGSTGSSAVRTFVSGAATTDSFTGGGSKDPLPISKWAYSGSPTPNKDTLNAAYAAAYNVSDFDVVFGADRLSPSGDANIGIWFFQQNVAPNGTGGFTGAHVNGDVLVLSAFTNGGGTAGISVFKWDSTCTAGVKNPAAGQCADTNLRLLAAPTQVCGTSYYCAITNSATTLSTWEGNIASPLFFEGGVDITQAFGGSNLPCFSSFLVETRSSQSTSAVLKDFIAGGFPVCSLSITKACTTPGVVSADGTTITYSPTGTVVNTGIGTLTNVTVTDTPVGMSANTVAVTPSTLTAGQTGTWSDSYQSTATSIDDSAFATANAGGTTLQSSNTAHATCAAAVQGTLTISKSCTTKLVASGGVVTPVVTYGGQVCNPGASKVTDITLVDYPDSSNLTGTGTTVQSSITLGPGTAANPTCVAYGTGTPPVFTYTPTLIDQTIIGSDGILGDGPGRYFFSDLIDITHATPAVGTLKTETSTDNRVNGGYGHATASCPICQGSGECTAN